MYDEGLSGSCPFFAVLSFSVTKSGEERVLTAMASDSADGSYDLGCTAQYEVFGFSYAIGGDGDISVSSPVPLGIFPKAELLPDCGDIKVVKMGDNRLIVDVRTSFYDFRTRTVVCGLVKYKYERAFDDSYRMGLIV